MKSYTITVNGKVYDVTVEETTNGASAASASVPGTVAPAAAPALTAAPASAGSVKITAGAAGKVVDIVAAPGASVAKGDTILILEIMKMETPVVATEDGTVASIEVSKGQTVAAGELLASLN